MGTERHRCVTGFPLWTGHWDRNSLSSCCPEKIQDEAFFSKEKERENISITSDKAVEDDGSWCDWPSVTVVIKPVPALVINQALWTCHASEKRKRNTSGDIQHTINIHKTSREWMRWSPQDPPVIILQLMQNPAFLHSSAACSSDGQGPFLQESNLQFFWLTFRSTTVLQFEKILEMQRVE